MPLLEEQLKPWFESLGLATLAYHWHIILLSNLACNLIFQTSIALSPFVFPKTYPKLQGFKRANWDIHTLSMVHCITIVLGALPMLWDPDLLQDRVFGYSSWAGNVFSIACGYFLWDIFTSLRYWKEQGIGFVFHGICSFTVYILSFRPFLNYYGAVFLMFEMSTPFLNINWFLDKLGMTGSPAQIVNGIFLLLTFFWVRLVFGFYMSYRTYVDVSAVIDRVPTFHCVVYGVANVVLNFLNVYWFGLMIKSLSRRFKSAPPKSNGEEVEALLPVNGQFVDTDKIGGHANGMEPAIAMTGVKRKPKAV
ncbi:TLC domain-containing protein [Endogone sp. FLAS-F59071]|nr:TLC domain-containing protein [Endogone sp. FLAS-F59071]|eukprot:RUS22129.1 TLC domain-containing protein [Endogone sp. FLAS-F59071]